MTLMLMRKSQPPPKLLIVRVPDDRLRGEVATLRRELAEMKVQLQVAMGVARDLRLEAENLRAQVKIWEDWYDELDEEEEDDDQEENEEEDDEGPGNGEPAVPPPPQPTDAQLSLRSALRASRSVTIADLTQPSVQAQGSARMAASLSVVVSTHIESGSGASGAGSSTEQIVKPDGSVMVTQKIVEQS